MKCIYGYFSGCIYVYICVCLLEYTQALGYDFSMSLGATGGLLLASSTAPTSTEGPDGALLPIYANESTVPEIAIIASYLLSLPNLNEYISLDMEIAGEM